MKHGKTGFLGISYDYSGDKEGSSGYHGTTWPAEKWLMQKLLHAMGGPQIGVQFWDGQQLEEKKNNALPQMRIRDRGAFWRLLINPGLNFGDDYSAGRIEVEGGLVAFLENVYRAEDNVPGSIKQLRRLVNAFRHFQGNKLSRARDNIYHHYDIGNDFYRLWLDKEMVYTCAYFSPEAQTLEAAQTAKMDHVCRKLRLKPGESVVEAGCGWGSLARHMAKHYGVKVRAFNISHEQIVYARDRARAEGLDSQIEYVEDDYRNISGRYDAFASVGMLEHVGLKHYRELGEVVDRSLKETGRGLVHSIGQNQSRPTTGWTQKRIFPGGYPPTLREMMAIFEPNSFSILDVENLRLHYARTLEHWLERFEQHLDQVRGMYDECFVRAWRLYLSGSIANFTTGNLQLYQVLFSRQQNNDVPLTRDYLYRVGSD